MVYYKYSKRETRNSIKELFTMTNFENITLNGRPLSDDRVFWAETQRLFREADESGDHESAFALVTLWDIIEWWER